MHPPERASGPDPTPSGEQGGHVVRFGDLELNRHSITLRGPKGIIELSLGEFRICVLLVGAGGANVSLAELIAVCGGDALSGRHGMEQAISRLRTRLRLRGSTVTVEATRGVGWRLLSG